jgi:hypothetical protein
LILALPSSTEAEDEGDGTRQTRYATSLGGVLDQLNWREEKLHLRHRIN